MKKWFPVLLVVALLCSAAALADEPAASFSIRNGVQFGDSVDDVKSKDEVFKNVVAEPYDKMVIDSKTFEMSFIPLYPAYLTKDVELAGAPVSMDYFFADSGLKEIRYITSTNAREKPSMNTLEAAYDVLKPALTEKYGKELEASDPLIYAIEAPALGHITDPDDLKVRENYWLVQYDDYYVKICLYCNQTDLTSVYFGLSYYMVTQEEFNTIVSQYKEEVEQFYDSVKNSI